MILSQHMNERGYVDVGRTDFMARLSPFLSQRGLEQVEFAYPVSKYAHRPQMRDDGTRYFEHPKTVAWLIFERYEIYSWRAIVIALLHDIIEDSFLMNEQRIRLNFGKRVARGVVVISKNTIPKQFREDSDAMYYQRFLAQGSWECLLVKVVDRIHNLSTLEGLDPARQERKIRETEQFFPGIVRWLAEMAPEDHLYKVDFLREDLEHLCLAWADQSGQLDSGAFDFQLVG